MGLAVGNVAFFDDERVDPIAGFLFPLETFDELQEAILKLESKLIESFEIGFAYLLSVAISVQSGNGLAQRAQAKIQELEILSK